MFAEYSFTTLSVVSLLSLLIIPGFSWMLPSQQNFPITDFTPHTRRQLIGNSNAAGDLYGIGIRVGAYLQIAGMLLSCFRSNKRSRTGIRLLSAAVCVSLLTSWTVLVCLRNISPCEAWLVLALIHAYSQPGAAAMNDSEKKRNNG